jgi:hypoxanthine phosphoribosyltransferase
MEFLLSRRDLGDEQQEIMQKWKLILTDCEIDHFVQKCADKINNTDFHGKEIVIVGILKGAVFFFVDLVKKLNIPYTCYFVEAGSYKNKQTQDEKVEILSIINPTKFIGKHVILIDELFDNGTTLHFVKHEISRQGNVPLENITTCTLFKKKKETHFEGPDFYGVEVPDVWLVGYGLDDRQEKRGWTHLFGCPKLNGLPKTEDDSIFEDDRHYILMRDNIKNIIQPNQRIVEYDDVHAFNHAFHC